MGASGSLSSEIRETRLETSRSARVCLAGGRGATPPVEVWYVLHGYRQLAHRFLSRFLGLASDERLVVAPEGLSRFYIANSEGSGAPSEVVGASWMTRHDREAEIHDYIRYLDRVVGLAEPESEPVRRTLLGFSQGAHTAVRWAIRGRTDVGSLVLWGAGLPNDLPDGWTERLSDTEVVLVRGAQDRLRRRDEEELDEQRLLAGGLRFRVKEHSGGHEIAPEVLRELTSPV